MTRRTAPGRLHFVRLAIALLGVTAACSRPPPASTFPSARVLLKQLASQQECSRGLSGEAAIDYVGDEGHLQVKAMYVVARPARVRLDMLSPLGGVLSTLASDGTDFTLSDLRERVFVRGPANQCSLAEALGVPVPPSALAQLLTGVAPVLQHEPAEADLQFSDGHYRIGVSSARDAEQQIVVGLRAEDWDEPWQHQRLRLASVRVRQRGTLLYEALLSEYEAAQRAAARVDPDGIEPPIPPSGPSCRAELPRRLQFIVPTSGKDLVFEQRQVEHNPPLVPGVFRQQPSPGLAQRTSSCSR